MANDSIPHKDLIQTCLKFCEEAHIAPTTFGQKAVKDRRFLSRLQAGGRCWPETETKVRRFIARERAALSERAAP